MLNRYEPLLTLINHCKPFLTTCFNRFFLISLWLLTGLTHFDSSNRGTYLVDMHMWWVLDLKNEIAYSTTKWNVSFLLDGGIWIPYPHIFKWFPTQRMCFVYELYIYVYIYESSKASYDSVVKGISHPHGFSRFNRPRRRVHFRSSSKEHEIKIW
jgi:hypothetical protein